MQDEGLLLGCLHLGGQVFLGCLGIDDGVLVVFERPEYFVDPKVNRRRLNERFLIGVDTDPTLFEGFFHGSV